MEDSSIIQLYWERSEQAILETDSKYGKLCRYVAMNILRSPEDGEECVNDAYLGLWNAMPPQRPSRFSVFVSRVTRNLALKKYDYLSAAKRNPEAVCSLSELEDCVSGRDSVEDELENRRVEQAVSDFLWRQEEEKRVIFLRRYWYFESIDDICRRSGYSRSKVTSMLHQTRKKLRAYLEKEGIEV